MRTIIFSHNLFKEGLEAFHPVEGQKLYSQYPVPPCNQTRLYGYLLLDFKLTTDWDFGDFVLERSIEFYHGVVDRFGQECVKSFVSPVLLPDWVGKLNGHLFLLGLSAVLSFCTGRPVYSPRNDRMVQEEECVELQSFFHDNISNLKTIKNIKAVVTTKEGIELIGRFVNSSEFPEHNATAINWCVSVNFDGGAFIAFFLDKNGTIKSTQDHEDVGIGSIKVVKTPDLHQFSMMNTVTVRGASGPPFNVHSSVLEFWKGELEQTFSHLFKLKYAAGSEELDYKKCIQAMRLIQLAHQNHREDFDLSFSLLVAATEAIAQIAITSDEIPALSIEEDGKLADLSEKHPDHRVWMKNKSNDEIIRNFREHYLALYTYVKEEKKHRDLAKRFVAFCLKYCPIEKWKVVDRETIEHGFAGDSHFKMSYDQMRERMERKPEQFGEAELRAIIKDTYRYRSDFFHEGKPSPHNRPEGDATNRFFEEVHNEKEWRKLRVILDHEGRNEITPEEFKKTKTFLISHDVMTMMATRSIFNYLMSTD